MLVVCQKTLVEQWRKVILEELPGAAVIDAPTTPSDEDVLTFHVTHYEKAREQLKPLRRTGFDMMVVDEAHKIKSRSSKQSRRLWLIGKKMRYRLALTGTPIEGNELDFWAQMRYVDDRVFGSSWTEFVEEWTRPSGFMGKKPKLKTGKLRQFLRMIDEVSFIVSDEESLNLPSIEDITVTVPLAGKQLKAYQQMEQDLVVKLPGLDVGAPLVVTQLIRLQQIVGGFVTDDEGTLVTLGTAKLDACEDLVDAHPAPIVIYARFLWEIAQLALRMRKLGREVSVITGEYRLGSHTSFDVLICQVGIVAGLDEMQHVTSHGIFYSKPWSSIQYRQALSRLRRKGQENRVKFWHIQAKSTIDIDLDTSLKAKGDITENVVAYLLNRRKDMAMAKPAKTAAAPSADPKPAPAPTPVEKFGIGYLATELDLDPATVRVKLRAANVEKNGGRYIWPTAKAADEIVKLLSKAEPKAAEAPAPKKASKKAA